MIRATPQMRDFAERVIAFETQKNRSAGVKTPGAFSVCEMLRPQWANLMGNIGFRALLSRALIVARVNAPWLRAVQVGADGLLDWLDKAETRVDDEEMVAGSVVLVSELLGLLEGFIGENLAMRLMQDVWPKLPPPPVNFSKSKGVKI